MVEFNFVYLFVAVGSYFLGTIPFGLILTQLAGLGNIREIGSGNIGATNVLRTGRKDLALATVLFDTGKGTAAVLLTTGLVSADHIYVTSLIAGLFAVIGHDFPLWIHFKGGKGVATTFGVLLVISWPVWLLVSLTWLGTAIIFRYSSLAALLALTFAPIYALVFADHWTVIVLSGLTILGWFRHSSNIYRLMSGKEKSLSQVSFPS